MKSSVSKGQLGSTAVKRKLHPENHSLTGVFLPVTSVCRTFNLHLLDLDDYRKFERTHSGPHRISKAVRVPIAMHARLESAALTARTDVSTLMRCAVHEYFANRGVDAFMAP